MSYLLFFAGGIYLFLFGIKLMTNSLTGLTGSKLKTLLAKTCDTPVKGFLMGIFVTALWQSSSLTSVVAVGLVHTNVITLIQGISIVLGSNVGTTVTVQLLSINIEEKYIYLLLIGLLLKLTTQRKYQKYSPIFMGLGLILFGMNLLTLSVEPLQNSVFFDKLINIAGSSPMLGIIIGTISATTIQSSSAVIGSIIALAKQDMIDLAIAISIALGADIGTCFTSLLASTKTGLWGARVAVAHLLLNLLGAFLMLPFLKYLILVLPYTSSSITRQIANGHAIYNLASALIALIFIRQFVKLVIFFVPDKDNHKSPIKF